MKPIYSLWHDCDLSAVLQGSGRRTLVDLFYQDDQFMNSGNAFVQDSYSEKVSHKVACMLSCLGGDLVECCFIILFL